MDDKFVAIIGGMIFGFLTGCAIAVAYILNLL